MVRHRLIVVLLLFLVGVPDRGGSAADPINARKSLIPRLDPSSILGDEQTDESRKRVPKNLPITVQILNKGNSSKPMQEAALKALPLDRLDAKQRARADNVLTNICMFRRLPVIRLDANADVYRFFMQHPDTAVSIWRAMQISKFEMWQTGPENYEADTKDGTVGLVEVLHRADDSGMIVCSGEYRSALLLKPVRATALLYLKAEFNKGRNDEPLVTHHLDMFVSFDSNTVTTAAKIVSPLSNMILDRNFREVSLFAQMMSSAMERQPGWVERIVGKIDGVLKGRQEQLLNLTARVYVEGRRRSIRNSMRSPTKVTLKDVVSPLSVPE
ncbi:MAG: hypothetical protein O3A00_10980 [Planctomycetota bacterium]|nr:hypothetical protein [Planctomycetota bacterium]